MMEVGDYVRTKYGNIGKITNLNKQFSRVEYKDNQTRCDTNESNILKSSPNIIDLIEVGDYVNGCKIIELTTNIDGKVLYLETDITEFDNIYACGYINIYEKDIRTIVTKEQFESMEYKV